MHLLASQQSCSLLTVHLESLAPNKRTPMLSFPLLGQVSVIKSRFVVYLTGFWEKFFADRRVCGFIRRLTASMTIREDIWEPTASLWSDWAQEASMPRTAGQGLCKADFSATVYFKLTKPLFSTSQKPNKVKNIGYFRSEEKANEIWHG